MEINNEAQRIIEEIGAAINRAVERSPEVAAAIEHLRAAGYDMELVLRLDIGLRERDEAEEAQDESRLNLTDEDRRTLRKMKIRIDEAD